LGGFCLPTDTSAQEILKKTANLHNKWNYLDIFDTVKISLLIAVGIGLIWLVLVQILPRFIAAITIFLAIITLIALGVLILLDNKL
jgi:hypothetical protein